MKKVIFIGLFIPILSIANIVFAYIIASKLTSDYNTKEILALLLFLVFIFLEQTILWIKLKAPTLHKIAITAYAILAIPLIFVLIFFLSLLSV